MIYLKKGGVNEKEFVELLEKTRFRSLETINKNAKVLMSGTEFQSFVYDKMRSLASRTKFDGAVQMTGPHDFPDIVAKKYFGVEVKATIGDKWSSVGNSVLETTRPDDVERIYLFFGKFGKPVDIRYRRYQECLYDITVTHSPRYLIDMGLPDGESIFDKMGVDYDALRKTSDPISEIKRYYRQQLREGEELWWIDSTKEERTSRPVITPFSLWEKQRKNEFMVETMALFPEIFGSSTMKFERVAAYLVTNYGAVSSNIRDAFSAGGMVEIMIGDQVYKVPKIFGKLHKFVPLIADQLSRFEERHLAYYWRVEYLESNRLQQWIKLLNEKGNQPAKNLSIEALIKASFYEADQKYIRKKF